MDIGTNSFRWALLALDKQGNSCGHDDVHTKIEMCKQYFEEVGLGAAFVEQFVR